MTTIPQLPLDGNEGWLILVGGGEFSFWQTQEADRFFLSKLPSKRIAFIPAASGSQDYAKHFGDYLRRLDPEVEVINIPIYRPRDARRGKNLETIRESGGVYIGGGVTNLLLEAVVGSPFGEELREVLARGGAISAIGAGAAALGTMAKDMRRIGAALPGIGLLSDTVVEPGFDIKTNKMLQRILSTTEARIGIGVPPLTALAISPQREGTIIGEGSVAVVRKPAE